MRRIGRAIAWTFKMAVRVVLPFVILAYGYLEARRILEDAPAARTRPSRPAVVEIDVAPLVRTDFRVVLPTQGTVGPRTRSVLRAEVSGRVTRVDDAFHDGSLFEAGDVLVELDRREFELEVARLTEELAQSRASLTELDVEIANYAPMIDLAQRELALQTMRLARLERLVERGATAETELEEMRIQELSARTRSQNLENDRSLLVARRQRIERAIELTRIQLDLARLDLERTTIVAPYPGQVLRRSVDVGQYVAAGAELGTIYAVDVAEIRLPLTRRQLGFIDLFFHLRGQDAPTGEGPAVPGRGAVARDEVEWEGRIVRTEGAIDPESRQLFLVARIEDPYGRTDRPPLLVGTFVQARVEGRLLERVFVLPRSALRGEDEVYVVDGTTLRRQRVEILWSDADVVVVRDGIEDGDLLCTSPVVFAGESIEVKVRRPPTPRGPQACRSE